MAANRSPLVAANVPGSVFTTSETDGGFSLGVDGSFELVGEDGRGRFLADLPLSSAGGGAFEELAWLEDDACVRLVGVFEAELEGVALAGDVFPVFTGILWIVTPDPVRILEAVDTLGVDVDFPMGRLRVATWVSTPFLEEDWIALLLDGTLVDLVALDEVSSSISSRFRFIFFKFRLLM